MVIDTKGRGVRISGVWNDVRISFFRQLAAVKTETETAKAEIEGHKGNITILRGQLQVQLTSLTRKSRAESNKF